MSTDTEARWLADLKRYAEDTVSGKAEIGNPRWLNEQLSQEWLALLERTRLTESERRQVEAARHVVGENCANLCTIIDRITQPEPSGGWQDIASAPKDGTLACNGLDTPERVRFYEHDFYVLSNFSAFRVRWRGLSFDTSEAAYHWERFATGMSRPDKSPAAASLAGHIADSIRFAPSAHEAFKIAQKNKPLQRDDWDVVKCGVMRDILRAKADQHEYVCRKLLATGDRELVEDSWRDDFWGWGPNQDGQNMLGKLWMEVRAELRASAPLPNSGGGG